MPLLELLSEPKIDILLRGPLDIPDPQNFTDCQGYEKCVAMCKKSIEGLVSLLEEEEAAEARRRPKIIKLADPTIYTITSPSQWQRNKLRQERFVTGTSINMTLLTSVIRHFVAFL